MWEDFLDFCVFRMMSDLHFDLIFLFQFSVLGFFSGQYFERPKLRSRELLLNLVPLGIILTSTSTRIKWDSWGKENWFYRFSACLIEKLQLIFFSATVCFITISLSISVHTILLLMILSKTFKKSIDSVGGWQPNKQATRPHCIL